MSTVHMELPRRDSGDASSDSTSEFSDPNHPDACTLFVGDISKSCTEEDLKALFETHGTVAAVVIKRDRFNGNSLGYAFVQFENRANAAAAKKALHKHEFGIPPRPLRLGWAQKNTTLFVGDLDTATVSTDQLRALFRAYGPLHEEETFVKHRNYGFVKFRFREDAERAKKELDGRMVGSRPIRIGWGDANTVKHTVHAQFEPGAQVSEAALSAAFSTFGRVTQVALPRTRDGGGKGFALIHYEDTDAGEEAAAAAIRALDGQRVAGVLLQTSPGRRQNKHNGARVRGVAKSGIPMSGSLPIAAGAVSAGAATVASSAGSGANAGMVPVYVMAPVGPNGQWQPVPYMMPHHYAASYRAMHSPHHAAASTAYYAPPEKDG